MFSIVKPRDVGMFSGQTEDRGAHVNLILHIDFDS